MTRAELSFEGPPPYPRYESGDCQMTENRDGTITFGHVDPRILISAELLDAIRDGGGTRHVRLDHLPPRGEPLTGAVLTIDGVNRRVIYRVAEQVPDLHAYYAEWPD